MSSKLQDHRGALQVNLGSPFRIVIDVDSDLETPSPLSLCFDISKLTLSPLKTPTTPWSDFDSDSDSDTESELDSFEDAQDISIPWTSPFYSPPTPPTFQTVFDLPPLPELDAEDAQIVSIPSDSPFYSPPIPATFKTTFDLPPAGSIPFTCYALEESNNAAELFHAELERIIPTEVKKDLFLVDEECLQGMDEELFSAPMDAFMDVCLSRLRPATLPLSSNEQHSADVAAVFPKYHLASFLDLQRLSASSLDPTLSALFSKRALSTTRWPASPVAL
ncbi:hypothetical protein C8R44DRAFT_782951 [Mycena epipterygia]|nr:hypothetical protein C8R44DRAFT_782951 [Mycena epipterygia]